MIDIELDMVQYDCPYIDTTVEHDVAFSAMQWDFDTRTRELETRIFASAPDRECLDNGLSTLRDHPKMRDLELLSIRENVARLRTTIDQTEAMRTVREGNGYITGPFHIEAGSEIWHVGFDAAEEADETLAALDRHNDYEVESREAFDMEDLFDLFRNTGPAMSLLDGVHALSPVERETLRTAVEAGYFNSPRDATLATLAEEFDVSRSAAGQNLRRAQQKLLTGAVDALDDVE